LIGGCLGALNTPDRWLEIRGSDVAESCVNLPKINQKRLGRNPSNACQMLKLYRLLGSVRDNPLALIRPLGKG